MAPVPAEAGAFRACGKQAAEMGSVLAAEAPASTAEASSVHEWEASGCAEE